MWGQLLDFSAYPKKVDKLDQCSTYFDKTKLGGSRLINARFLIKAAPGFAFEYYCAHEYEPTKKSLTWTLDYSRDNDFDDVCGKWYVTPHPTKPEWSQVYYSADLSLKGYVPGFIMGILTSSALKSAVTWVKKYSELDWAAQEERTKQSPFGAGFKGFQGLTSRAEPPPLPPAPVVVAPKPFFSRHRRAIAAGAVGAAVAATAGHFAATKKNKS